MGKRRAALGKFCAEEAEFALTLMKHNDTQKYGAFLKALSTQRLEGLLSNVLREMRSRDSDRIKGDAISTSQAIRALRSTGKLT